MRLLFFYTRGDCMARVYQAQSLLLGPRFVYFNTLGSEKRDRSMYLQARAIGTNLVNEAAAALMIDQQNACQADLEKIKSYVELIGQAATNARSREIKYLTALKNQLTKSPILTNDPKLLQCLNSFLDVFNGESTNFNYLQFIDLFNRILKDKTQLYADREAAILQNMKLIEANYLKLEQTPEGQQVQKQIQEAFIDNYAQYKELVQQYLLESLKVRDEDGKDFILNYAGHVSSELLEKINSALYNLPKNTKYLNIIKGLFSAHFNEDEVATILKAQAIEIALAQPFDILKSTSGKELADQILNSFGNKKTLKAVAQKILHDQKKLNTADIYVNKAVKTLEEISIQTGKGLADIFTSDYFSPEARLELMQDPVYGKKLAQAYEAFNKHQTASKQILAGFKANLTKILNQLIRAELEKNGIAQVIDQMQAEGKNKRQILQELKRQFASFFNRTRLRSELERKISVRISNAGIVGELLAGKSALNSSDFVELLGGREAKADLIITINWGDLNLENKEIKDNIENMRNSWYGSFITRMQSINHSKYQTDKVVDVNSAITAFKQQGQETYKALKALLEASHGNAKDLEQIKQWLNNSIIGNISVKDYNFYASSLGVHGGSLGNSVERILDNITTMYEAGGITPVDADLLIFAVNNCGENMLGSNLKAGLETYLLGGAALLMFDDAFTLSNTFLEKMQREFGIGIGSVEIYNVSGKFIPASLVYTQIYNNLCDAYSQIENTVRIDTLNTSSSVQIMNNISPQDIPKWDTGAQKGKDGHYISAPYAQPQARWNAVAALANTSINIRFSFLAGLLDIFTKLPEAFNI